MTVGWGVSWRPLVGVVTALAVTVSAACAPETRNELPHAEVEPAVDRGLLSAASPSGVLVTLDPGPYELAVGPIELVISLADRGPLQTDLTVDVVAPEMPSHGVVRFPTEVTDDPRVFVAKPEIPMEGRWLVYVNLDYGEDAAEFELQVAASEGLHVHGAMEDPGVRTSPEPGQRPEQAGGTRPPPDPQPPE